MRLYILYIWIWIWMSYIIVFYINKQLIDTKTDPKTYISGGKILYFKCL